MIPHRNQIQTEGNIAPLPRGEYRANAPKPPESSQLEDFFEKLDAQLERRHEVAWRADYLDWLRVYLTYTGKHLLQERKFGFGFNIIPLGKDDPIYPQNKIRFYSDDVTNQWVASDPKIDVLGIADSDDRRRRATRVARALNDHYNRVHFTEQFKQITAKLAQFCGNYHAEVYFDPKAKGGKVKQPIIEQGEVPGAASWLCASCGMSGEGELSHNEAAENETPMQHAEEGGMEESNALAMAAPVCPSCGSDAVEQTIVPPVPTMQIAGYETVDAGDIRCEPVPAWQLRYERGDLPEKSGWLRRSRDLPIEYLKSVFPDKEIKPTQQDDTVMHPDRVLRRSSSAIQAGTVYGQGQDDGFYGEFIEFWYEPEMYRDCVLKEDEQLFDGRLALAGSRLSDLFPHGLYRAKVRGCKATLLMREESHRDRFEHSQFILLPGRGVGDNIRDGLELQRQDTILNSIRFQAFKKAATPTLVVNDRLVTNSQLITKPGAVVKVNGKHLRDNETVQSAFGIIPATPPTPALDNYMQYIEGGLQKALKSLTLDSGLTGFKSDTAYGDKVAENKTALARTSELALLADWYKRICAKRLKLAQQYFPDERIIHYAGDGGEMEPLDFKGADVDCDFVLWVRGTSYMPNSPMLKQANLQGAIEATTALKAADLYTPLAQRLIDEIFDVELSGENTADYSDWTRETIALMEQALPQVQQMAQLMAQMPPQMTIDPMTGQIVPVDPLEMAGQAIAQAVEVDSYELGGEYRIYALRQWLTSPEGRKADRILRAGVHVIIDELCAGIAEEQRRVALIQSVGQPISMAPAMPPTNSKPGSKPGSGNAQPPPKQGDLPAQSVAQVPPIGRGTAPLQMAGV